MTPPRSPAARHPDPLTHARRLELAADGTLTVEAAAAFMGCGRSTVFELIKAGELLTTKVRRRRCVFKRSAVEYLAAHAD